MAIPTKTKADAPVPSASGAFNDNDPHVAALATGGFTIGAVQRQSATNPDVVIARFGALGASQGTLFAGYVADIDETDLSITGMADGSYFYAYRSTPDATGNADIKAGRYDPDGAFNVAAFTVNTGETAGNQVRPEVVALTGGRVAISWIDDATDTVKVRIFNGNGTAATGILPLSTDPTSQNSGAFDLGMTALANDLLLVSWRTDASDAQFRVVSATGTVSSVFDVTPPAGIQGTTSATKLADGRYVITFFDTVGQLGQYARIFEGTNVSVDRFLLTPTTGALAVTGLNDGRFMIAYADGGDIRGRIFNGDGTPDSDAFLINDQAVGTQSQPSLDVLADGRVVVAWHDANMGAGDVVYTIYDPRESGIDITGTSKADEYVGSAFDDTINGDAGNDWLDGGDGDDYLFGGFDDDELIGGEGNDILDGANGTNTMLGGAGNDTYWINGSGDFIDESASSGIDQVFTYTSFELGGAKVSGILENLTYVGAADAMLVGNGVANVIGSGGARILAAGLAGNDVINGNLGNDILDGGADDDELYGKEGNDRLDGGTGDDFLDGGAGPDSLKGGAGDDIYVIDDGADYIEEEDPGDGGIDEVRSFVSFNLNDSNIANGDFENLRLLGDQDVHGLGNEFANFVEGNSGENFLFGYGGDDRLEGGGGNDSLDGGDGADHMEGGHGNDSYHVTDGGDVVDESNGSGVDTVTSTISFSLSSSRVKGSVESLVLQMDAVNGTGNALDNDITGNHGDNHLRGGAGDDELMGAGGADLLDGGAGNDLMQGGDGSDSYVVGHAGDVVDETGGDGIDTVRSSISFSLSSICAKGAVEHLKLLDGARDGTGNTLGNTITGNGSANLLKGLGGRDVLKGLGGKDLLDGGTGADLMQGGTGNDVYVVDRPGDVVDETVGTGIDTVRTRISFSLASSLVKGDVERLALLDGAANGSGNALANTITGNGASNLLKGLSGDDTLQGHDGDDDLDGGTGADVLHGGDGSDTASYASASRKVSANLKKPAKNKGDAKGDTYSSIENLTGSAFADTLIGNDAANRIKGGKGSDKFVGGKGADILAGNVGADTFIYARLADSTLTKSGRDVILDFSRKDGDRIDISALDPAGSSTGTSFEFIGKQAFTGKAGELRFEKLKARTFVYGDANGDAKADIAIELAGKMTLKAVDFVL